MKSVVQIQRQGKVKDVRASAATSGLPAEEIETKVALIQALIPLGLHAVGEALEAEVVALAGARYRRMGRQAGVVRWGRQRGSVYWADQKLPLPVPRLRDRAANREVALTTYEQLQRRRVADAGLFRKVLVGLTCRQYEACAEAVPKALGLSTSSVSRRFIRVSARHLATLCERRLDRDEFVAWVLDGKTFAEDAMVIALGFTLQGAEADPGRRPDSDGERAGLCGPFLRELITRGLRTNHGLLCVIDGATGLRKAIQTVFGAQAFVQRCQWHKRENVVRYLPKGQQAAWRRRQQAYERPTYAEARTALGQLRQELRGLNVSAVASLEEGREETLTLHRLGLFPTLGVSLKTTNCLESLNAQLGQQTDKVDHWHTADQKHRWVASALILIEPRLRRITGDRHLPLWRAALQTEIGRTEQSKGVAVA